jgi:GMP synthase (glutamine-hydrolysing)
MGKRVLCVRHGDGPTDDRVTNWCVLNGARADIRRPFQGDRLGEITEDLAAVVVYGGMYDAYATDRHPFLLEEYRMIDHALKSGTPLLGICQGAQMIAHHLGAFAGAPAHGLHEFGYYEVSPTEAGKAFLPKPLTVCQAHYHTYDLPSGAVHLARSEMFEQQAFSYGETCVAVQFHPENTLEGFRRWQAQTTLEDKPGAQSWEDQERAMLAADRAQAAWFYGFLDGFLAGAKP